MVSFLSTLNTAPFPAQRTHRHKQQPPTSPLRCRGACCSPPGRPCSVVRCSHPGTRRCRTARMPFCQRAPGNSQGRRPRKRWHRCWRTSLADSTRSLSCQLCGRCQRGSSHRPCSRPGWFPPLCRVHRGCWTPSSRPRIGSSGTVCRRPAHCLAGNCHPRACRLRVERSESAARVYDERNARRSRVDGVRRRHEKLTFARRLIDLVLICSCERKGER